MHCCRARLQAAPRRGRAANSVCCLNALPCWTKVACSVGRTSHAACSQGNKSNTLERRLRGAVSSGRRLRGKESLSAEVMTYDSRLTSIPGILATLLSWMARTLPPYRFMLAAHVMGQSMLPHAGSYGRAPSPEELRDFYREVAEMTDMRIGVIDRALARIFVARHGEPNGQFRVDPGRHSVPAKLKKSGFATLGQSRLRGANDGCRWDRRRPTAKDYHGGSPPLASSMEETLTGLRSA